MSTNPRLKVVGGEEKRRRWRTAEETPSSDVTCLWKPYLILGAPNLLTGAGSLGKSTVLAEIAARGSRGDCAPDGQPFLDGLGIPFDTAILGMEDPYDRVVRPRLEAMGADLSRIILLDNNPIPKEQPGRNLRFVFLDGWKDFILDVNTYDDNIVRPIMLAMGAGASQLNIALVGLVHPSANNPKGIAGSKAFFDNSRAVLSVARYPTVENTNRIVMRHQKYNWTGKGKALAYEPFADRIGVNWLGPVDEDGLIEVALDADEIGRKDAKTLLREVLGEMPRRCEKIVRLGQAYGIQARTLRKARVDIGAIQQRFGFGKGAYVMWFLNEEDSELWRSCTEEWRQSQMADDDNQPPPRKGRAATVVPKPAIPTPMRALPAPKP